MKRKVLILASWFPSEDSPVNGIFVQEQAQVLTREYDVAVLVPKLMGWRQILKGRMGPKSRTEQRAGLLVCYERGLTLPVRLTPALAYSSYARAAKQGFDRLLKTWGKPDIIHAHVVLPGGWAALKIAREYSIPVVLTEHSSPFSMHLGTKYKRWLVKQTLTQADSVIAVSPALARQILEFQDGIEINVVGELVRSEFFVPLANGTRAYGTRTSFLCIALLTEQKGLSYLLEAAQLLIQRGITSFELVIGGDGRDRGKLEQMVEFLGLRNWCRFLGLLDRDGVRYWMQQCDVFVLPSLHETFGIVLGEAMACGKPVISTRCGGPEFVVTPETGVLVDVANPEAIANAMAEFILGQLSFDPEVVRSSVVSRFGEEAFLRNISTIYERVWLKS